MITFSVGLRFGRLVLTKVLGYSDPAPSGTRRRLYEALCDCGTVCVKRHNNLQSGITNSCGCLQRERTGDAVRKHGQRRHDSTGGKTKTYRTWLGIKARCSNPTNVDFHRYGARGINVCQAWDESFEQFLADMGQHPGGDLSIDRIDVNGNYEPGNCRWATPKEQANNRRSAVRFEYQGRVMSVPDLAAIAGVSVDCMYQRLRVGHKTPEQAVSFRRYA